MNTKFKKQKRNNRFVDISCVQPYDYNVFFKKYHQMAYIVNFFYMIHYKIGMAYLKTTGKYPKH